jgi:hypothetical protein
LGESLVTVATFSLFTDADLARVELGSAGIECFTENENTAVANLAYSNAIGGIAVKVKSHDAERAGGILDRINKRDESPSFCPRCDSEDIELIETKLVFGLFKGYPKRHCRSCGHKWERVGF